MFAPGKISISNSVILGSCFTVSCVGLDPVSGLIVGFGWPSVIFGAAGIQVAFLAALSAPEAAGGGFGPCVDGLSCRGRVFLSNGSSCIFWSYHSCEMFWHIRRQRQPVHRPALSVEAHCSGQLSATSHPLALCGLALEAGWRLHCGLCPICWGSCLGNDSPNMLSYPSSPLDIGGCDYIHQHSYPRVGGSCRKASL